MGEADKHVGGREFHSRPDLTPRTLMNFFQQPAYKYEIFIEARLSQHRYTNDFPSSGQPSDDNMIEAS
jgi:hypothetical protein